MGCPVRVKMEGNTIISVTGNTCNRGDIYARKEVTNPTRIVTTTIPVSGGSCQVVSVKTKIDIPKDRIFDCIRALKDISVKAPVFAGDVVLKDVAGTGVDIVTTRNVT